MCNDMRNLLRAVAICIMSMVAYACSTDGCLENRSSIPLAGFYDGTGAQITLDSLRVTGISDDSLPALSEEGTKANEVYLPMRPTKDNTTWQLAYKWKYLADGSLSDTISFDYTASPYFASDECGVIYRYNITEMRYTTHLIDSIKILDSLITNIDKQQIKIYFRTAATDEQTEQ